MTNTVWDAVLARIETKVNRFSYFSWFHPTRLVRDAGDRLLIQVPNAMSAEWLTTHYPALVEEALAEVGRPGVQVSYEPSTAPRPTPRWYRCPSKPLPPQNWLRNSYPTSAACPRRKTTTQV